MGDDRGTGQTAGETMLNSALKDLNRLLAEGTVSGLSDAHLMDRFVLGRDAAAFEALVARHGPMVLGVCRSLLDDPNDAEDAFQATFLILVQKARTIRGPVSLGGWLYLVAHRVAVRANVTAERRRAHERRSQAMTAESDPAAAAARDERQRVLHEELARLSDKYRQPIILCDLQGIPQERAAAELQLSERTLRRRLGDGRERLKTRLTRRGQGRGEALLGTILCRPVATVSDSLTGTTVRAAMTTLDHAATAGIVSAAAMELTRGVLKTMLLERIKLAAAALLGVGIITWGASAALVALAEPNPPPQEAPKPPAAKPERKSVAVLRQEASPGAAGTFPVRGRVLDPDGKPVAGAAIYVRHHAEIGWTPADPFAPSQKGRVGAADADGRFHVDVDKAPGAGPQGEVPDWQRAQVAVVAPGYAPAWAEVGSLLDGGEATLRLGRDDVPVRGRVLDTQGRPIAGATVRLRQIGVPRQGADLDSLLASGVAADDQVASWYGHAGKAAGWHGDTSALWPGGKNTWTTDAKGRFEVRGVGRDRIARLDIHAPGAADGTIDVMARPAKAPARPRPRSQGEAMPREYAFMGPPPPTTLVATGTDYVADPAKPIVGVVRLKGAGTPVAGVVVRGIEAATRTAVTTKTDAEGRFRLDGLPKGALYQVRVDPKPGIDPFLRRWITVDDTDALRPIEAKIELARGVIVTGRLVDKTTGQNVAPADVKYAKLVSNGSMDDVTLGFTRLTDSSFGLTVPPGPAVILASLHGRDNPYAASRLRPEDHGKGAGDVSDGEQLVIPLSASHAYRIVDIPADGGPVRMDLELVRGASRKGRLVGPDGEPVSGVRCYGLVDAMGQFDTLDGAEFEVMGLAKGRPRRVLFAHEKRKLVGSITVSDADAGDKPLVVRLGPACTIKGRLVEQDGVPVANAEIMPMTIEREGRGKDIRQDGVFLPAGPGTLWPDNRTYSTDSEGRFEIVGLKPGVMTCISITSRVNAHVYHDAGGVLDRVLLKQPGEVRDFGDVKVKPVVGD